VASNIFDGQTVAQAAASLGVAASPNRADLGQVIRRLRQKRDLSIETLAGAAEMHPTYLSGIERGHYNPSWDKLVKLASALGVPLSAIVAEAERT
jgi:transcriptional regulator with XRE-family HTH domain